MTKYFKRYNGKIPPESTRLLTFLNRKTVFKGIDIWHNIIKETGRLLKLLITPTAWLMLPYAIAVVVVSLAIIIFGILTWPLWWLFDQCYQKHWFIIFNNPTRRKWFVPRNQCEWSEDVEYSKN